MKQFRPACLATLVLLNALTAPAAEAFNSPASMPDAGTALFRVVGALLLVFALLFGGVWLARNWHRVVRHKGRSPKLQLLEARSLGGRQGVYVIGYEQQRFLVAASPAGVSLLSHLPESEETNQEPAAVTPPSSFFQALQSVLSRPS